MPSRDHSKCEKEAEVAEFENQHIHDFMNIHELRYQGTERFGFVMRYDSINILL